MTYYLLVTTPHPPNWASMTPGQKAAWTRRQRLAGGVPPASAPKPKKGPVYTAPDPRALSLEALSKLEDALAVLITPAKVTADLDAKFKTYQKVKALALNPGTPAEGRIALSRALRTMNELVATVF